LKQTRGESTRYATLERMRRALPFLAAAALAALVVIGLTQAGGSAQPPAGGRSAAEGSFDLAAARERLRGAPAPLAALHEQANELLPGGKTAFQAQLRSLIGHPVVVNKWASWCGPCRAEFPIFQSLATQRGRRIAFLGVNGNDKRPAAMRFLERYPVPFPSFEDPDEAISRAIDAPANYPVTVFVDQRGRTTFIHQGGYRSAADLAADIDRHL
jgi:cytochrome c biogenesis protein CcmG/thiol:disulfide interchange protein DsbE